MASDDIDVRKLIDEGYDVTEINELLEDEGYDQEDIAEAWVDVGYDYKAALLDAIQDQAIDIDDYDAIKDYADILDLDVSDIYGLYHGSP